jgi:decaprenyl-phosphate phosphoribosyltransferase
VNASGASSHGRPAGTAGRLTDWFVVLRPRQWAKNVFVLAPLLFAGRANEGAAVAQAVESFVAFCLAASGVYLLNDVVDRAEDRAHPLKRARPVAAGRIGVRSALVASLLLGAGRSSSPGTCGRSSSRPSRRTSR